ncbi:hypothetical protein VTK73DRAFT_6710 [Phialemonium thermophilum]|uniref:Tyrosine specific protein phosphatases domain-containing protein n=1 Tax=Phialemonium thermophilum TaxID=223376 RepID=A0ABR3XWC8_9PEZI
MTTTLSAADLRALAETDAVQPLHDDQLRLVLSAPPFVHVPGTYNIRDLGLVPSPRADADVGQRLRPRFAYRAGALTALTDEGKAALRDKLGVRKVFDLRTVREREHGPAPSLDGIPIVWIETEEKDALVDLPTFREGEGEVGYRRMYLDVLRVYRPNFRAVLEHVRDHPEEPFLFHCTAGRDRTGVLAGLLHALAGADPDTIVLDFLLSRVGTEPVREMLLAFAMRGAGVQSTDAPGFQNMCNLRASCWRAFLDGVEEEYGGFEDYVTKALGFSEQDVATIKRNLVSRD